MTQTKNDYFFLQEALRLAEKAYHCDEVPIGAVLVDSNGVILARGYNQVEQKKSQLYHAELVVLGKASKKKGSWYLEGTTLYVSLQPCMMCLGALYLSRVSRVVYGAQSSKFGCSIEHIKECGLYKNLSLSYEYMEYKKSEELLKLFFQQKRRMNV